MRTITLMSFRMSRQTKTRSANAAVDQIMPNPRSITACSGSRSKDTSASSRSWSAAMDSAGRQCIDVIDGERCNSSARVPDR
jgi:hypothetical protein